MTTPAALPFFGDAYLADTQHLTLEEHGAYFKMLLIAWRSANCELPDDDRRIATMLGITPKKWATLRPVVIAFWTKTATGWQQNRLTKERRYVAGKIDAQSAKAGERWKDQRDDGLKRSQRLAAARQIGTHTAAQWDQLIEVTGRRCAKCHAADCELVKDHIKPIYQGGSDALRNLQPLCRSCNSGKGADATDYRLSLCKDLFERLPECLPERLLDASQAPAERLPLTPLEEREEAKHSSRPEAARAEVSEAVTGHLDDGPGRTIAPPKPRSAEMSDPRILEVSMEIRRLACMVTVPGDGHLVREWLDGGADPARHIYPTIERLSKGKSVGSFKYFDAAIREAATAKPYDPSDPDGRIAAVLKGCRSPVRTPQEIEDERLFKERAEAKYEEDRMAFYADNPALRAAG